MNRLFESCLAVREARNSLRYKGMFSVVIAFLLVSFGGGLVASIPVSYTHLTLPTN